MTWAQFKTSVKARLGVDANRQNLSDYLNKMIEDGLREVVRLVPELWTVTQEDHSLFGLSGFKGLVNEGHVSIGQTAADSTISNAWIISRGDGKDVEVDPGDGDPNRMPLKPYSWENRNDLKHGHVPLPHSGGVIAISPDGAFYVYPYIKDHEFVRLEYRSKEFSHSDNDVVEYTEDIAECVSFYVKSMIMREVDHDLRMYSSYQGDFVRRRAKVKREWKEKGNLDIHYPTGPVLIEHDYDYDFVNE